MMTGDETRVVTIAGPRELRESGETLVDPAPGRVLVDVTYAGICGRSRGLCEVADTRQRWSPAFAGRARVQPAGESASLEPCGHGGAGIAAPRSVPTRRFP